MLHVVRPNKEISCIICWHDEKSRRKEHDALCHWRECIKNKKGGEGQAVVYIEEAGRRAPNQEKKVNLMKDLHYAFVCKHLEVFKYFCFDVQCILLKKLKILLIQWCMCFIDFCSSFCSVSIIRWKRCYVLKIMFFFASLSGKKHISVWILEKYCLF